MERQDHRARVTIMLIRKAFTDLLKRKPVQSISVKELCAAAGISRGTFYSHYTDVYDLMRKIEDEMYADFVKRLQPLLDENASELTPFRITASVFECLKENADLCAVTLGPFGDRDFAARLLNFGREKCIETYLKLFEGATPRQLDFYYSFVSAGCIGLLERWMREGMISGADEIADMAKNIMMRGIGFLQRDGADDGDINKKSAR